MKSSDMLSYFGLREPPFSKEIATAQLHLLPSVQRNLAAARLLVETRGIGVICGKAGTGKTCLLRLLCDGLPTGLYKSFYLSHSSIGIVEFYTHLCSLFGLEPCYRRASMFRELQQHILTMATVSHLHPLLLIDEAHLLSNDILAEIRLLMNFHFDSLNALTVVLCGNETLTRKFGLSVLESLANSITITIPVDTLPVEETCSYIETLTFIHQASGGILRTIGTIGGAALVKACLANSKQVEAEHVQSVIQR